MIPSLNIINPMIPSLNYKSYDTIIKYYKPYMIPSLNIINPI